MTVTSTQNFVAVTTPDLLTFGQVNELERFLEERQPKFKDQTNLARMMRVTFSGLLRGLKTGTLSVENCLRLADVLGEDPGAVLRVAKKPGIADQLERVYGRNTKALSADERELLATWQAFPPQVREALRYIMDGLLAREKKKHKQSA